MGNALSSQDDLRHVRGWTSEQITTLIGTLRRKHIVYSVTKDDFTRFFGGRNREAVTVFNDLDDDDDGRVDIFEVFVVVTMWSGTAWDDKMEILFQLFDMMGKGFLKVDEVMLMGTILMQVLKKFMQIDSKFQEFHEVKAMKDLAHKAFPPNETKLTNEHFRMWAVNCKPLLALRGFLEDWGSRGQADSNEGRMRQDMQVVDRHATHLFERIEKLHDRLPDFVDDCIEYVNSWGRRKRWDFIMQNLRHLILKLQQVSETLHVKLTDLGQSLNEDEVSGGMASIIDPKKRFSQEHMLLELNMLRSQSLNDYREGVTMLQRLMELAEAGDTSSPPGGAQLGSGLDVIREQETNNGGIFMSRPQVTEAKNRMLQLCREMVADISDSGIFGQPTIESLIKRAHASMPQDALDEQERAEVNGQDAGVADAAQGADSQGGVQFGGSNPTLVVIADFDPPPTHQTQLLKLRVGELITVVGQDGRGWWYGRNARTHEEGWFPPSYVQLKPAHFSSGTPGGAVGRESPDPESRPA